MKHFLHCLLVLSVLLETGCSKKSNGGSGTPQPPVDTSFVNPLLQGSDPWVIRQDTLYYYTHTSGNRIFLWKTGRMSRLAFAPQTQVFSPVNGTENDANIWAPELHRINNKWYLYYTAGNGEDVSQRLWVLENENADPTQGTWADRGRIASADAGFWAIDATVLEQGGSHYLIWSGRPDQAALKQNLYISRMSNPWTLEGKTTLISEPLLAWERKGHPVNEAPQVLKNPQGKVFLTYSASSCFTDEYTLGLLTLKEGGDPLNAADWTKSPEPVFTQRVTSNAFGPGHNSFFTSRDGNEYWMLYHANTSSGAGCGPSRSVRMQRFDFDTNGRPVFGEPVKTGVPVRKPGGE